MDAGDATHLRPARYDAVLSVLFPDMAPRLANGYGREPRPAQLEQESGG